MPALARSDWKSRAKIALKLVLTGLVFWFAGRHIARTWHDLRARGEAPRIDAAWAALAVALYVAGLAAFGAYFWRVVHASASPVGAWAAIRAYLISHLGKYVPGKAMVVVMRVGLVVPYGARPATAAFATLYETLVMMAAGGFMAAVGFATAPSTRAVVDLPIGRGSTLAVPQSVLGLGLGLAFLAVTWPAIFPRLAGLARQALRGVGPDALPRLSYRLMFEGMAWAFLGWTLLGLSQVAVIRAVLPGGIAVGAWPLAIASVALATVAGFAVPIAPGGLGVREWVLWTALAATLDSDMAVVSALVLRLAWVAGEVAAAGVSLMIRPAAPAGGLEPS
ncbi:lysylphosphatidylglycerol synthase domain-containing protein [Tundrisphaera sp. TA3]|uniref:lysylphosphatidylglycerol synthase domain-containing protein n=1 Tax=Tundrisphaera sp. TA3 TaxID=3435775 RepID=UPI003EBC09E5